MMITASLPLTAVFTLLTLALAGGAVYALVVFVTARLLSVPLPLRMR
jgi:hypothetical protein